MATYDVIEVSYSRLKAVLAAKKIRPQYEDIEGAGKTLVFAYDGPIKYTTLLYSSDPGLTGLDWVQAEADYNDFINNVAPSANRSLQTSPIAALSKFHGRKIEMAPEDTEGYCEWAFDADAEVNKVMPKPISAEWGDYVTMEVWAKPGVMGPDAVKVEDFGSGIYLMGGDGNKGAWYEGSGGGKIPSYCTIRCIYHKAAGTARKFLIDAEFYE